jgi:predicted NBD/HSP70 family sugar kinase
LLRRTGRPVDGGQHAIGELLSAAAAGDRDSLRALERQGYWLGVGLAGLVNVFDPDIVVLGGMFRRVHGQVIDALRASLETRVVAAVDGIAIVPSALGSDVALLGAAELAFDPLLTDPLGAQPG